MPLLNLCEPLFLKVCELNRMARIGQSQDYIAVRSEIQDYLGEIHKKLQADPTLARLAGPLIDARHKPASGGGQEAGQVRQIELVLVFFVDSMIASSQLKFASQWNQNRLATEKFNELAGDETFFDILDTTINDPSDEAAQRLAVFYTCLGLGFVGFLAGQPDELKRYMNTILPRIKHLMDVDTKARLCQDAYEHTDRRVLIEPPSNRWVFILVLFVFLCLSTMVAYIGIYANATDDLNDAIDDITKREQQDR